MIDYVINLENRKYNDKGRWDELRYFDAIKYAKYLKQPIKPEMFLSSEKENNNIHFTNAVKKYFDEGEKGSFSLIVNGYQIAYYKSKPNYWVGMDKTIKDLCGLGLELSHHLKL